VTLPYVAAVRCTLRYNATAVEDVGNRFFLSYSGSAPSPANCTTLAGDIQAAFVTHLTPLMGTNYELVEVDVLDLGSDIGASGQNNTTSTGTRSGVNLPQNCNTNVELGIARRYRGGKPRIYFPFGTETDQASTATWTTTYIGTVNTDVAAFFAALEALSVGSMGTLAHVNISYYKGKDTNQPPAGKWRGPGYKYPPLPRATPLFDTVESYICKATIGSQRRRLTST
jgi:hypothetical protein